MRLHLLTVRRWWVAAVGLAAMAVAAGTEALLVPVPTLTGGMSGAPARYFSPVLLVGALVYVWDRRLHAAETTTVRHPHHTDHVLVLATLAVGCLVTGGQEARNAVLLSGVALVVHRLANAAAATLSALAVLVAVRVAGRGIGVNGEPTHTWWAVPLHPADGLAGWVAASAVLAAGMACRTPRPGRAPGPPA
ncbi:hypothetical protein [Streptomyces sudanensis]|uniref:hypothetical protein n=1 Tax=Streptomyces sudanensis TaxID=436397 RepID=UPI0020CFCFF7|nr:hypothetical protein [Streptomyces sudanensis]MCQ0000610.1 hypothetical protein [Streptomyces sudanensis]